jgi:hypothetical protein
MMSRANQGEDKDWTWGMEKPNFDAKAGNFCRFGSPTTEGKHEISDLSFDGNASGFGGS